MNGHADPLVIPAVLSAGAHLAAAVLVLALARVLPPAEPPREQGTVELLMIERQGAQPSEAGQPSGSTQAPAVPASMAPPAPSAPVQGEEPAPMPAEQVDAKAADADATPESQQAEAQAEPPRSRDGLVSEPAGSGDKSDANATGEGILPASLDNRFGNWFPPYPREAQRRGEYGTVTVLIHVSGSGLATGVDVRESSGHALLDQAAVAAVRKWRFRPAIKDGRSVPFDMPFRFIFEPSAETSHGAH